GLMLITGAMLLSDMGDKLPLSIEFNNRDLLVKIKGNKDEHVFSYAEAERFLIRNLRSASIISLRKKDGSIWDLMSFNSFARTEKTQALLQEKISLGKESLSKQPVNSLPVGITKYESPAGTYFCWKERRMEKQLLMVFMFVSGFGMCLGSSFRESKHEPVFLLGYLCFLSAIAVYFLYTLISARINHRILLLDTMNISYGRGKLSQEKSVLDFKAEKTMSARELDSIRYSFDGHQSLFYSILFLDKETAAGMNALESENSTVALFDIAATIKMYRQLFKFNVAGKSCIEIANFTAVIQEESRKRYHKN
ncbi:MAG: hypothetical protein ACJ75J_09790, partial [Cytophagaceae bacterium]